MIRQGDSVEEPGIKRFRETVCTDDYIDLRRDRRKSIQDSKIEGVIAAREGEDSAADGASGGADESDGGIILQGLGPAVHESANAVVCGGGSVDGKLGTVRGEGSGVGEGYAALWTTRFQQDIRSSGQCGSARERRRHGRAQKVGLSARAEVFDAKDRSGGEVCNNAVLSSGYREGEGSGVSADR